MNYKEALDYIHGTLKFGSKLGLLNITSLLERMGNPHKKLRFVHVAGTNGKGSTVAFISSILKEAGYRTGVYTSPYIERFTERIRIDDEEISEENIARITLMVKNCVDEMVSQGETHPTEFEIVTALAFQYYFESACDIVVLEVGLGGRLDSTNVIDTPLASVITTISFDHTEWLGDTLDKIAFEKAGIIKHGGDVIIYPQQKEAMEVFKQVCNERNAKLHVVDTDSAIITDFGIDGQKFEYGNQVDYHISLLGEHQVRNAAVAIDTCRLLGKKGLSIEEAAVKSGLMKAKWPGRLEVLAKKPVVLIDGAHNKEGAYALTTMLRNYFPDQKIYFVMGVLKDKDFKSMLELTAPLASGYIAVTPDSDRAMPAEQLAKYISEYCKNVSFSDTIENAVNEASSKVGSEGVVCAFGSLYYIGEVRGLFVK